MSFNPTAPGGPVTCPTNALPVIDRTKSQCGQTIQVPPDGLWYTLYVTAIRGDTTFGVDPSSNTMVQVYPSPEVNISRGEWGCDPTVFGHILKGSTCWYKFFVKQPSTTGSVKFVLTIGGDSCIVYFAPQGAQPTPSPTPTPPQPQPTAPSCDVLLPPPCTHPGYTCTGQIGICCCKRLAQPTPPPGPSPQPPQPSPCPPGTSCLDYSLCEARGGTCKSDCGVGCCCKETSPSPQPPPPQPTPSPPSPPPSSSSCPPDTSCLGPGVCLTSGGTCVSDCGLGCCCKKPSPSPPPQPSPPPAPTPSPSPKPECPTGTVCVDPDLCGGGGTCVSSCSRGCCCQPPSNIPPPPPPAPQPPGLPGRKPQPF